MLLDKLGNAGIIVLTYVCMAGNGLMRIIRRWPKLTLIVLVETFAVYCVLHAFAFEGNKPFFSLTGLIIALVLGPIIYMYDTENKPRDYRQPDLLSTELSWFDEAEKH